MNINEIIFATKGRLLQGKPDIEIKNISTDSRNVGKGDLFIAICGEKFNGHNFVQQAIDAGAAAVIIGKECGVDYSDTVVIQVEDTTKAYADIAAYYRNKFDIPAIAITGSNGKTTTKELIAALLEIKYRVLKNNGTENNHIGVPKTILKLNPDYDIMVLELGASASGEIDYLANIVKPKVGVLTNIGPSHIEFFGSLDNIFTTKIELIRHIEKEGFLIVNNDDDYLKTIYRKKITFGIDSKSLFTAGKIEMSESGTKFILNNKYKINLNILGKHNIYNVLAAIACADIFDVDIKTCIKVLSKFIALNRRMDKININGFDIIDDSYNSNPLSVNTALEVLKNYNKRKIFVSGDMLELGDYSEKYHYQTGRKAAENAIDIIIGVGKFSKALCEGAIDNKMNSKNIYCCKDVEQASAFLKDIICKEDIVLVKGSRSMKMERIIESLK